MDDDFNYKCRPRSGGRRTSPSEENFGAGSGGEWYDGGHDHHYNGCYQVSSPYVNLVTDGPPEAGQISAIQLLATAADSFTEAAIVVHADNHVRITTGGSDIPVHDSNPMGGFRVIADTDQIIALSHGPEAHPGSGLRMSSDGVLLSASGDDTITIKAAQRISLQVAGGTSSIELTGKGIIIDGPMVWINCDGPDDPDPPEEDKPWLDF